MSFVSRIIGTVTFNRDALKDVHDSSDATNQAWLIIIVGTIITALLQALAFDATQDYSTLGSFGALLSGSFDSSSLVALLVISFLIQVLFILLLAGILAFVGRGLGGNLTTMGVVRLWGFITVLSVLSAVVSYIAAVGDLASLLVLTTVISLWELVLIIYGLAVAGDMGIVKALVAVIIGYILFVIVLFILIILLVVALLSALGL